MSPETITRVFLATIRNIYPELRISGEVSAGPGRLGVLALDSIRSGIIEIRTEWQDGQLFVSIHSTGGGDKKSLLKRKNSDFAKTLLWVVQQTAALRFSRSLRSADLLEASHV